MDERDEVTVTLSAKNKSRVDVRLEVVNYFGQRCGKSSEESLPHLPEYPTPLNPMTHRTERSLGQDGGQDTHSIFDPAFINGVAQDSASHKRFWGLIYILNGLRQLIFKRHSDSHGLFFCI